MDIARISLASSGAFARQISGMFQVTRAPTLTGHWMLAVVIPACPATSQVGTRMSSVYQYQPPRSRAGGRRWYWRGCRHGRPHAGDERGVARIGHRRDDAFHAVGEGAVLQKAAEIGDPRLVAVRGGDVVGPEAVDGDQEKKGTRRLLGATARGEHRARSRGAEGEAPARSDRPRRMGERTRGMAR